MHVSFRFIVWEIMFSNSASEISLSINAFEIMLRIELSCSSIKIFCFSCLWILLKRNFSIPFKKIEALPINKFNPWKTFPEIVLMISSKFDKNPTFRRNIQNWKIKSNKKLKSSVSNDIFLSLQSVLVFLHGVFFQFYEFHVVCIN